MGFKSAKQRKKVMANFKEKSAIRQVDVQSSRTQPKKMTEFRKVLKKVAPDEMKIGTPQYSPVNVTLTWDVRKRL